MRCDFNEEVSYLALKGRKELWLFRTVLKGSEVEGEKALPGRVAPGGLSGLELCDTVPCVRQAGRWCLCQGLSARTRNGVPYQWLQQTGWR